MIYHVRHLAWLYTICVTIGFIGQGTHFGSFPALVVRVFGMKSGGKLASINTYFAPISGLTSSILVQLTAGKLTEFEIYLISTAFNVLSLIILFCFFKEEKVTLRTIQGNKDTENGSFELKKSEDQ